MQINDKKTQSLDFTRFKVELLTVDAQPSYNNELMVIKVLFFA